MLPIRLSPDKDLRVESIRIGNVPTLILRPAKIKPVSVGVLWIHGGGFILGMKEMAYMGRAADLVKKYGTSDQFRVLLLDGQGNPFPNQIINFNINGVFYSRLTDVDGYAKLNIRLGAAVNEYIITSTYNGTSISNKIIIVP